MEDFNDIKVGDEVVYSPSSFNGSLDIMPVTRVTKAQFFIVPRKREFAFWKKSGRMVGDGLWDTTKCYHKSQHLLDTIQAAKDKKRRLDLINQIETIVNILSLSEVEEIHTIVVEMREKQE